MGNQYWKSDNQISRGVSHERIESYKKKVAEHKPLVWKKIVIPVVLALFIATLLASGISKVVTGVADKLNGTESVAKDAKSKNEKHKDKDKKEKDNEEGVVRDSVEVVSEPEKPIEGVTADGLYKYIQKEDTITIIQYLGNEQEVIIPSEVDGLKVTVLGDEAFVRNDSIVSVVIPDTVIEIQDGWLGCSAFGHCNNLTSVSIPGSVKGIGAFTFNGCEHLEEVHLEEGIESIGVSAFEGCYKLKELVIPKSVKKLGTNCLARSAVKEISLSPQCEVEGEIFFWADKDKTKINYYE